MATYTKVYNNPYPDGWKDGKDGNTPVTADILNNQTETLESIEQYLADNPIEQGGSGTGGTTDYEALENKPTINGVEVVGDLSLEDLGITGGGGSGTTNYEDLTNKPSINGTELSGDITLDIPTKTSDLTNDSGFLTEIPEQSYNDLSDKPQINGIDLQGNLTVEELGLLDITESTDTTLENSKDGVLKIKEIYGNTEQDTTSGNQLFDYSGLIQGAISSQTGQEMADANTKRTDYTSCEAETSYTVGNMGGSKRALYFDENKNLLSSDLFTTPNDTFMTPALCSYFVIQGNNSLWNEKVMLNKGTTALPFEKYTGGMASPNPEYEQEVKGVKGKNQLDCSGLMEAVKNGITFTPAYNEQGLLEYINVNGTATADATYDINLTLSLPFGSYTLSGCPSGGSVETYFIGGLNADWDYIGRDVGTGVTINVASNRVRTQITVKNGVTVNDLKFYPMIRKASIADGSYVPYGCLKIKAVGKNLNPNPIATTGSTGYLNNSTGTYGFVKANETYTISFDNITALTKRIEVRLIKDNTKLETMAFINLIANSRVSGTFTPTQDGYIAFNMSADSDYLSADVFKNIQVEEGEVATEYEPYKENSVFLPIPEMHGFDGVRDTLESKKFKEVVFNGSESGWKQSSTYNTRYYINLSDAVKNGTVLCTQGIRRDSTINGSIRIDGNLNFSIDTTFATLADWKAHLASKPMKVTYELAEPIETPLPDADVEALKSLKTYDGVTHIFTDSEVEPDWLLEYNTTRVGTELDEIDAELVKINKRITDIGTTAQMNYSTEEQVVGTWIDGRPIYQKTITDYDILNTENGTVLIAENLDYIIENAKGNLLFCNINGSTAITPIPYFVYDPTYIISTTVKNGFVVIEKGSSINLNNYSSIIATLTFFYVKTTDAV